MKRNIYILILIIQSTLQAQQLKISEPVKFLALGDSYTAGTSVDINEGWPYQLFNRLSAEGIQTDRLEILAWPGWTTNNLTRAIREEKLPSDFNLVSLLIGVNNQYREIPLEQYEPEFENLLIKAVELAGGNKSSVFVLSIPDYAFTPFGKGDHFISSEIEKYNNINRKVTQRNDIAYFDNTLITQLGLDNPELIAEDGLHPSSKMYELWVDKIMTHIKLFNQPENSLNNNTETQELLIYPNPASDYLVIRLNTEKISGINSVSVYSITGILLLRNNEFQNGNSSEINLVLPDLNNGIYLIEILTPTKHFTSKFIIKRDDS